MKRIYCPDCGNYLMTASGEIDCSCGWKQDPDEPVCFVLEEYDAGLLKDYGGGDVDWWHYYIRVELERAYDFYQLQLEN